MVLEESGGSCAPASIAGGVTSAGNGAAPAPQLQAFLALECAGCGVSSEIGIPLHTEQRVFTVQCHSCGALNELTIDAGGAELVVAEGPSHWFQPPLKREAAAVCWSNFANYFAGSSLGHSYTLEDTVRYYLQYETLMGQWKNYLQSEIYEVSYENLTIDPGSEIRRLIEHLELPWDNLCLLPQKNRRAVRTASMGQIGKPIYKNSSASWKKYSSLIGNKFDRLANFDHHSENK